MHQANIDNIRQEVLRLLKRQHEFLTELLDTPDLLKGEGADGQRRILDRRKAEEWQETCETEIAKVERLEMTLAVVGTMKAGKSTTINAIVGTEVLPNRNRPMTTMPTLIRHVPGQVQPKLEFRHPKPMAQAVAAIKAKLEAHQAKGTLGEVPFYASSQEGKALVEAILSGTQPALDRPHVGPEAIFAFLAFLNDVTRLCQDARIDVPSPLGEYDNIDEFPLIEVEFYHLKQAKGDSQGRFTLVDTPGPNEHGQSERLTEIWHQQLEQASAVLAVLDYTQLGSDAGEKVQTAVEDIANRCSDHLYVLVNKFDAKDRNSQDFEAVRRHVVERLFDGVDLDPERVYPVSSMRAYLANRARGTLDQEGTLPSADAQPWVADFGQAAFGGLWEDFVGEVDPVRKAASKLWDKSLFVKPLDEVIRRSHGRAALASIESALVKMREYNKASRETLQVRTVSLDKGVDEVAASISALAEDIERVQRTRAVAENQTKAAIGKFQSLVDDLFKESSQRLDGALAAMFEGRKREEAAEEAKQRREEPQDSPFGAWFSVFFGRYSNTSRANKLGIDPNGPNRFDSEEEARAFAARLNRAAETMIDEWASTTQKATGAQLTETEKALLGEIKGIIAPVLQEAEARLGEAFGAKLEFPDPSPEVFDLSFDRILASDTIRETTRERTRYRTEKRWYTLWLVKHEVPYTITERIYNVDARAISRQILAGFADEKTKLSAALRGFAERELLGHANAYIDALAAYLEGYRGTLLDAKEDLEQKGSELKRLKGTMGRFREQAGEQDEQLAAVSKHLQTESSLAPA
jgi:GTPase SAR1 family protein